ncbi:MAG: hypothetical protein IKZ48_06655 [Prevotella sp.]|nr:hypothetical protein [Prevotella sp.]
MIKFLQSFNKYYIGIQTADGRKNVDLLTYSRDRLFDTAYRLACTCDALPSSASARWLAKSSGRHSLMNSSRYSFEYRDFFVSLHRHRFDNERTMEVIRSILPN